MLRELMPGLSAVYGLRWGHIEDMPYGELLEYVRQSERWVSVISSGVVEQKDRS